MWIRTEDPTKKPEMNQVYWVSYIILGNRDVVAAKYTDKGWFEENHWKVDHVYAWWSEKKPEPMEQEEKKPYLDFPDFVVNPNGNGVNWAIKAHLLPEEEMRNIGFTDASKDSWHYSKEVGAGITFNLTMKKDNSEDFSIYVLDEDFGQPYDYQRILSKPTYGNPNTVAVFVYENVEAVLDYLQKKGVLSGHVKGEYV